MPAAHSILIVEDEAIVALDLSQQLEDLGYTIAGTAESGEQALALAAALAPELVLMDVRLKGAMDGIEAAETLRRERGIPVVFLTSHSDAETVQRAAQTAPYGYLTKPFQIRELRAGIEVAIYKSAMERRLHEAERWFDATLQCVPDGIVVTGLDGRVRLMNPAAERLTGWPGAEAQGEAVDDVVRFAPQSGDAAPVAALRALREGHAIAVTHARRLCSRNAQMGWVDESASPVDDRRGERLGAVLLLRDAGERLAGEAQRRASEERFRNAFDFAPQGMALVSADGRMLQVNAALCRFLGADADALRGHRHAELSWPDDLALEAAQLERLFAGAVPVVQFEKRYLGGSHGEAPRWSLVSVSLLREGDAPACLLYHVHDLTERKEGEQRQAELAAERLKREASELAARAKSAFISRASHEMRTPLNAVLGFAQLLHAQGGNGSGNGAGNDKVRDYAGQIVDAGKHLLAMVNDVLDLQRSAEGQLKLLTTDLPLDRCLLGASAMLEPMAREQQIRFELTLPPGLAVRADPTRLQQVLLNLGSNAVKYNRAGGWVRWSAHDAGPAQVVIAIEDNGIGITHEHMDRLFQPFDRLGQERTAIPGTGLGLLIARGLVEQMGGHFTLASDTHAGTRIEIALPRAAALPA